MLSSHGFSQLLNQINFAGKVARQNADVVDQTRIARRQVKAEAKHLETLEQRDRALAKQVLAERNQAAALQSALKQQQITEIAARAKAHGRYATVEAQVNRLQKKLNAEEAAAARAAGESAATGNASVNGITLDTNGMVQPPADAPEAVKEMIAAGNAIATLPYIYGGGHASFQANGYDCSGSVSYVLAAAGLVTSPMVSGQFDTWGDPGPGRWVTIYSNADHVWMTIAGWRFDTVAQAEDGGPAGRKAAASSPASTSSTRSACSTGRAPPGAGGSAIGSRGRPAVNAPAVQGRRSRSPAPARPGSEASAGRAGLPAGPLRRERARDDGWRARLAFPYRQPNAISKPGPGAPRPGSTGGRQDRRRLALQVVHRHALAVDRDRHFAADLLGDRERLRRTGPSVGDAATAGGAAPPNGDAAPAAPEPNRPAIPEPPAAPAPPGAPIPGAPIPATPPPGPPRSHRPCRPRSTAAARHGPPSPATTG